MTEYEKKLRESLVEGQNNNSKLDTIEYEIKRRLTEEQFIALANIVKETYVPVKMRYMFIIKKLKEYEIQPDSFIEIPVEFKMWEIFKKGCSKSNVKLRNMYEDKRIITYIDYKELFKEEIDFLNMNIRQITESTNLDELIPNSLKSTYEQVLLDKDMLGAELRKFMTEKLRRLRLYKSNKGDKLDKPYQGPETQEGIIDIFNKIYTNELHIPLDIEKENEQYRKMEFLYPELWTWTPVGIKCDFLIAQEMMNDPNFIDEIISIWSGFGREFPMDTDLYGRHTSLTWLISCEYNWLIRREESKEKPDLEKIESLRREAGGYSAHRLISPILLQYYSYQQVKRRAYEMYEAKKQQRQKNFTLKRELTGPKSNN